MTTETEVSESSSAAPVMEVSRGPLVNLTPEQRTQYKTTGELPKADNQEGSATSSAQGESGTPQQQEKPKSEPRKGETAEERIAKLESTIEKIKKGAGIDKPKVAESEPAKPAPETLRPRPKMDDLNADGTEKYASHDDYSEDLATWVIDKRDAEKAVKAKETAALDSLNAVLEKGRERYENLDEVIMPAANEIYLDEKVSPVIKAMIGDSEHMVDLLFTISSDKAEYAKFLKMAKEQPGKAIRYIALTESLIAQELEGKAAPATEETPAKPRTQAPRPPAEAGGRAAAPPDAMQAALDGSGGKLSSSVKAEFLRRDLARLKG